MFDHLFGHKMSVKMGLKVKRKIRLALNWLQREKKKEREALLNDTKLQTVDLNGSGYKFHSLLALNSVGESREYCWDRDNTPTNCVYKTTISF